MRSSCMGCHDNLEGKGPCAVHGVKPTRYDYCKEHNVRMPHSVCISGAGYYIGTTCPECGPYDRCSGYFRTREQAQEALDNESY